MRALIKELCPPFLWRQLKRLKNSISGNRFSAGTGSEQDLDVYWDEKMAEILETWGDGNVWDEIRLLLVNCEGRVLDIACGTGKTMWLLRPYKQLDVEGCDISDMLIQKAVDRGLAPDKLRVCDATKMPYQDGEFDYSYSIGSLEHFTEEGISKFAAEARRVTRVASIHMMPTSRSGRDEGWLKTHQSFFNSSTDWWVERLGKHFGEVLVLDSHWDDSLSVGKWFICRG